MSSLNKFEIQDFDNLVSQLGGKINIHNYYANENNIYIQITNKNPVKDVIIFDSIFYKWLENNVICFYTSFSGIKWIKKFEDYLNNY